MIIMLNQFCRFLADASIRLTDVQQQQIAAFVQTELANLLLQIDPSFLGLETNTDSTYYLEKKKEISSIFRRLNNQYDGLLTEALGLYAKFLTSDYFLKPELVVYQDSQKPSQRQTTIRKSSETLREGKIANRYQEYHKRNPELRRLCIEAYGNKYECEICGMNFEKVYGEIGKEFIEIHHINPIAETEGEHDVDPATDLIPLCSNCHSMIHHGENKTVLTPEQLREKYKGIKWNKQEEH